MSVQTIKIGKRGTVVIPATLRQKYRLEEGSQIIVESLTEGVLLRPVVTLPQRLFLTKNKKAYER